MSDRGTQIDGATTVDLAYDRAKISTLIDQILENAQTLGYGSSAIFAIRLAIEEAITNAFEHGHEGLDPSTTVRIEYRVDTSDIQVAVQDQGPGFVPADLPDPTLLENLSKPSGRGVMLMRAYMTEVSFNDSGNRVKLRYIKPK